MRKLLPILLVALLAACGGTKQTTSIPASWSPGASLTTGMLEGTTTVCSPPWYWSFRVRAPPSFFMPETVALVMLLPGRRSQGRCPSPVPRIAAGKTCTSTARSVPSGWATAVVPMNAPSVMADASVSSLRLAGTA